MATRPSLENVPRRMVQARGCQDDAAPQRLLDLDPLTLEIPGKSLLQRRIRRTVNVYLNLGLDDLARSTRRLPFLTLSPARRHNAKPNQEASYDKRECMGIEPTESFVQTLHWF